ncbi:MAG: tetratricopeptide repeat protein [Phaeodactylibacter sp.]|nr:tetratricopeptide repeat protein [Phaeodactylibacter sp.]
MALPKAFEFIYQNYMGGPGLQSWYARAAINPDNYYTEPRQQNQTYYQIPLRPTAALATVLLSKALELDDVQGAQAIIRDFQSRAPQDPALHALLAEFLHFDLHEPKAAERLYLLALEEYQRSTAPYRAIPTYFKLMDLYIGQQNGKAAWDLGQTARTLLKVSTFDYQLGKIADAFDIHLSEAIELNKQLLASGDAVHTDEVAIQFLLAGLYAKQGQPEQAKELLEKILQVQENHAGALKLLKQL